MPLIQRVDPSLLNLENFVSYTDSDAKDFHEQRKVAIMKKYGPKIRKLYGHCWTTKYYVAFVALTQLWISTWVVNQKWWVFLLVAWIFGGTLTHILTLAIHEVTHFLAFKKPLYNWALAYLADLPIPAATCVSFKLYHRDHHNMMGVEDVDTDIATFNEAQLMKGRFQKLIFVLFNSLIYSLRPVFTMPKPLTKELAVNWIVQLAFNAVWIHLFGWKTMLYFGVSLFLGLGLNPLAGHFISEHFVSHPSQDTYSYYGPLNYIAFNVGYHTEHHDFPNIPGSRLPELKRIAPEFYDNRFYYDSWSGVVWNYIMTDGFGLFNRKKVPSNHCTLKMRSVCHSSGVKSKKEE
uniref:Sphingolipid delta4-desaturase N-terminal domain-containing protein n=1 Tax=Percolomonas cosmopolitus TaxID=63605 RepID=A0A7S1KPU1_9EUKA